MNRKSPLLAVVVTVAVIGLSGCGSSGGSADSPASATTPSSTTPGNAPSSAPPKTPMDMAGMAMITIKDFAFEGPASVQPGAAIMVMNNDTETHTVTSDEAGMFDVNVEAGGTATLTAPTEPGTYAYHCTFHSDMHGSLVVK